MNRVGRIRRELKFEVCVMNWMMWLGGIRNSAKLKDVSVRVSESEFTCRMKRPVNRWLSDDVMTQQSL